MENLFLFGVMVILGGITCVLGFFLNMIGRKDYINSFRVVGVCMAFAGIVSMMLSCCVEMPKLLNKSTSCVHCQAELGEGGAEYCVDCIKELADEDCTCAKCVNDGYEYVFVVSAIEAGFILINLLLIAFSISFGVTYFARN